MTNYPCNLKCLCEMHSIPPYDDQLLPLPIGEGHGIYQASSSCSLQTPSGQASCKEAAIDLYLTRLSPGFLSTNVAYLNHMFKNIASPRILRIKFQRQTSATSGYIIARDPTSITIIGQDKTRHDRQNRRPPCAARPQPPAPQDSMNLAVLSTFINREGQHGFLDKTSNS